MTKSRHVVLERLFLVNHEKKVKILCHLSPGNNILIGFSFTGPRQVLRPFRHANPSFPERTFLPVTSQPRNKIQPHLPHYIRVSRKQCDRGVFACQAVRAGEAEKKTLPIWAGSQVKRVTCVLTHNVPPHCNSYKLLTSYVPGRGGRKGHGGVEERDRVRVVAGNTTRVARA